MTQEIKANLHSVADSFNQLARYPEIKSHAQRRRGIARLATRLPIDTWYFPKDLFGVPRSIYYVTTPNSVLDYTWAMLCKMFFARKLSDIAYTINSVFPVLRIKRMLVLTEAAQALFLFLSVAGYGRNLKVLHNRDGLMIDGIGIQPQGISLQQLDYAESFRPMKERYIDRYDDPMLSHPPGENQLLPRAIAIYETLLRLLPEQSADVTTLFSMAAECGEDAQIEVCRRFNVISMSHDLEVCPASHL